MKSVISLLAVWSLSFGVQAAPLEAISSYTVDGAQGAYVPGGAGFGFAPQTNMAITALGFYGTGLNSGPYRVTLWANGQPLATTVVTFNSAFLNQTRYEPIPNVQLLRGQTYYLSAAATQNNYWVGNVIDTNFILQTFSVSTNIVYLGSASGTNAVGEFPADTGDLGIYYVAPNFQYQIGGGTNLVWASTDSDQWDIATSLNWFNPAIHDRDRFYNGESVLFDDTLGVVTNIIIGAGVAVLPTVVTNDSSTNNFILSGAGQISGPCVLFKDGRSTLTLDTTNDFSGDCLVLGGTLRIGCPGALGMTNGATFVTNAATLDLNGVNLGSEPVIVSGVGVGGTGAIVNNGPPQARALERLILAGDATFGGTNRWDLGGLGSAASLLTGGRPWKLTKVGTNQVSLVGVKQIDPALGDIDIQQGTFSLHSDTGPLGDPSRVITVYSNAMLGFSNLSATPLNKKIILNDGATVYNEQGPSVVAGPVTLQGTNTFFVASNGAPPTLTFTSRLAGTGSLRQVGGGILVLAGTNTYTGSTLVSTGTLALVGSGTIASSADIVLGAGTALDVSARDDERLTLARGQTLSGDGQVMGSLTAGPGSTISPGVSIGLLTVTNDVVLLGTNFMELNITTATNDMLQSGANLTYGGTLSLTNLDGTLMPGDTFKLFSAAVYAGSFTNLIPAVPGSGLNWDTNLLTTNGTLAIVLAPPVITNITPAPPGLIIAGTNGLPGTSYYVLTTTNLALPVTNWTSLATNLFDATGTFIFTNSFAPVLPQQYYRLQLP